MSAVLEQDYYTDDDSHPIPRLGVLDAHATFENGSSELSIFVYSAMAADDRSQRRLIQKIDNYLALLETSEFQEQCGVPNPERTRIVVKIPYNSDPVVFVLLARCQEWVLGAGASLVVERIR